jgi:RNA polymerase sigma-70 factor (ECF subfamily)
VAQESFIRAWKHWEELKDGRSAGGWLKTVARNLCLNHLERYRARWKFFTDLRRDDDEEEGREVEFAAPETLEETLLNSDQKTALEEAVAKLPKDQRVALVLYHYEDLDYAEIATRLKVSLGKVKTDIFRARQTLLKKLQPKAEELGHRAREAT